MNTSWPDLWDGFLISPLNTNQTCFLMCPHWEGPLLQTPPSSFFSFHCWSKGERLIVLDDSRASADIMHRTSGVQDKSGGYGFQSVCQASEWKCWGALACLCACKPLIMRPQLRIRKVNKVMSLQQKFVAHNRALVLLDYHNHHPLVPKPVTQLLCSRCF